MLFFSYVTPFFLAAYNSEPENASGLPSPSLLLKETDGVTGTTSGSLPLRMKKSRRPDVDKDMICGHFACTF